MTFPVPSPDPGRPADRRLPIGLLLIAVAIIAFIVVAPRSQGGGSARTDPSPIGSPTPALATPSPSTSDVPASTTPASAQPGNGDCGRISPAACAKAIELARKGHEAEVAGATRIVVDDACSPTALCDRLYPFDAIVVFVTAGGDTTGWYSFEVVGLVDDKPTKAEPWQGYELPAHIVARLREPQPTP